MVNLVNNLLQSCCACRTVSPTTCHHLGSEVKEYVDPPERAEDTARVGCVVHRHLHPGSSPEIRTNNEEEVGLSCPFNKYHL